MNTSFYGGREGRSFVIAKEFKTIAEMVEKFRQGPSYKEVNFDEYVLINTEHKNNPENGRIFRRGYDFSSGRTISCFRLKQFYDGNGELVQNYYENTINAAGAVYIGSIVGPAGHAPHLNIGSYQDIAPKDVAIFTQSFDGHSVTSLLNYLNDNYGIGLIPVNSHGIVIGSDGDAADFREGAQMNADGILYYFYYDQEREWYQIDSAPKSGSGSYKLEDGSMVLGAYQENGEMVFNDTIDWCYYSIRDVNNEDTIAYIGFKPVVPVTEFEANSVSAYFNRDENKVNTGLISRQDDESHPFYAKWHISIPKGIKGDTIENIRVITSSTNDGVESYSNQQDDRQYERQIIVGDIRNYDNSERGEVKTYYLGDYNQVENMSVTTDGTFTIDYTHNDSRTFSQLLSWVTESSFDAGTGQLKITFNNNNRNCTNIDHSLKYAEANAVEPNNLNQNGLWFVLEEVDLGLDEG